VSSLHAGDLVRLIDGSYAEVAKVERGRLLVCWLKSTSSRWVRAREVEAGWRRLRRNSSRASAEP